jgi:CRP/FNR family cyclic AMP-dependent transcriptional regulator
MHTVRIELLQQMPIFGAIREDALAYLLEPAPSVHVAAGAYFFREGEPAQSMYVLESGRVSILKQWEGRELLLRELGAGDCIGEMALLDLFPRSASVRAVLDCTAIELTPAHLMRLYEKDLEQFALVQMNIAREMSRRLRVTDELLFRARMGDLPSSQANPEFDTVSLRIGPRPA